MVPDIILENRERARHGIDLVRSPFLKVRGYAVLLCYFAGGSTYSHTSTGTPHATHPPTQPLLDRHMVDNSVNAPQQWNSGAHPNYGAVGSYGGFVGQSSPLDQGGHPSVYTAEPGNRAPEPGNQNHMYQRQQHRDV